MHELSLAYSLVETAEQAARDARAVKVTAVNLQIGKLSGVVQDALLFSFDIATNGTLLAGAKLNIEELAVIVRCRSCEKLVQIENIQLFRCPLCQTPTAEIVQGREMQIVSIEIEETEDENIHAATTHT
jgi:hydrogenase nickel incorporation protein HypA/HybF